MTKSGIVNLGSGNYIQLKDFVNLFWKELGADPSCLSFGAHEIPSFEQNQPNLITTKQEICELFVYYWC